MPWSYLKKKISFKLAFSLSSFTLIKRFFSFSPLSGIRVVSSAYLRLLIFFLAILIPTYNSFSLVFHIMCSVYKLNKQGDNKQPCHTPFSMLNQSVIPYRVLTVASWASYRFLKRQVRPHLFKNFSQFMCIVLDEVEGREWKIWLKCQH